MLKRRGWTCSQTLPLQEKKKNMRSAEEVKASIQWVTAYKRQSLKDKLVNTTPQRLVPPATSWNSTETHDVSDEEDGGDIMGNVSYKPPSESTLDVP